MSKNIIYRVDQVDTYTTAEFDKILGECAKIKMPKEYLINLYSRVVSNNKDSAEHISPFEGTKNLGIHFPRFHRLQDVRTPEAGNARCAAEIRKSAV